MTRIAVLVALSLLVACSREEIAPVNSVPPSTVDALKRDLRGVMTAQERYYSLNETYAATLEVLRTSGKVELSSEGTVQLIGAPNSYAVSITKSVGPNASVTCRVEVGKGKETDGIMECE